MSMCIKWEGQDGASPGLSQCPRPVWVVMGAALRQGAGRTGDMHHPGEQQHEAQALKPPMATWHTSLWMVQARPNKLLQLPGHLEEGGDFLFLVRMFHVKYDELGPE